MVVPPLYKTNLKVRQIYVALHGTETHKTQLLPTIKDEMIKLMLRNFSIHEYFTLNFPSVTVNCELQRMQEEVAVAYSRVFLMGLSKTTKLK